jgi:hypothetical protein
METNLERGRRLGRKYVLVGFVTLASIFVALTTLEIARAVFGAGVGIRESVMPALLADGVCSDDIRGLAAAVERAIAASSRIPSDAGTQYCNALRPEWLNERAIAAQCASEPAGADAFATVLRMRLAGEELARRQAGELGPIRRTLAAYLTH